MRKKGLFLFSVFTFLLLLCFQGWAYAIAGGEEVPVLSITGVVKQPLHLTMRDLGNLRWVSVRYNVGTRAGKTGEEVIYRGVPLKTLLDLACVQKEKDALFAKPEDLAIVVTNKAGSRTALSWGEIFNRNPAEVIIALSPMESNDKQQAEAPQQLSKDETLERGFPRLIIVHDLSSDRSLKEVVQVEALKLTAGIPFEKSNSITSSQLEVRGAVTKPFICKELFQFPRIDVQTKLWEKGKDPTVKQTLNGVSLRVLLEKAKVNKDPNTVIILSAADGYRSLVSYGELFLSALGERMIIADKADNEPLKKYGKFEFALPDDLSPGRWVKAVSRIEVINLKPQAKLYILGVGCAETNLLTLEAISRMGEAGAFICTPDVHKRFSGYLGNKPVLFDQTIYMKDIFAKKHPDLSPEERQKAIEAEWAKAAEKVRAVLNQGQSVAFLDYGDPTLFGTCWHWLKIYIRNEEIEFVPGISAFNVSNALLKMDVSCKGSVVLSSPRGLQANEALVKAIAEKGEMLGIFMGLKELENIVPLLRRYYPDTTPVQVVYSAGYSEKEKIVTTTLEKFLEEAGRQSEKYLGIIYIGQCLQ